MPSPPKKRRRRIGPKSANRSSKRCGSVFMSCLPGHLTGGARRTILHAVGERIMFIGELAARAGVSVQAVRLYEKRGLMRTAARTAAGYRVYEPLDVELLTTITRCKALGLTLA